MSNIDQEALEAAAHEFAGVDVGDFEDKSGRYEWLQFFLHHTENGRRMFNSITAYLQAAGDAWEPISEKHKDGEEWLLLNKETGVMIVAAYDPARTNSNHCWQTLDGICYHKDWPDSFRPLPAPPEAEGQ